MSNEQANPNPESADVAEPVEPSTDTALVAVDDTLPAELAENAPQTIDVAEAKLALEAVLMAASEPMAVNELKRIFDGELSGDTVRNLLEEMRAEWTDRSIELSLVASGYRFRIKPGFQKYLDRLSSEKPPRYSRAVLETLAIIAYRQPVTRGDIEDIRGVQVSPHILKTLQDRGWIDEIGHKEVVGRPSLFATTKHFLDDLNLRSLEELPPLHELQATLDMTQAGAALTAGETPSLPGVSVASAEEGDAASTAATATEEDHGAPDNSPDEIELQPDADAVSVAEAVADPVNPVDGEPKP
mgnify:CR=1 FL=1